MAEFRLETQRLVLREWREADIDPMLVMRTDPRVMATLGPLQSRTDVEASFGRQTRLQRELGFCSWIIELRDSAKVIGTAGFQPIVPGTPMGDVLEIGWKLRFETWGHGYASEAARASLDWLFANSAEPQAWAITATGNLRSRAVMGRLGMTHDPALDFDHPRIAEGDPLRRHVTYSISREAWGRK